MKLTVDDQDYDVKFFHKTKYPHDFNGSTECLILALDTWGTSYCNKEDSFKKATGRKFALTRALNATMVKEGENVKRFSREFRTKFWKAYWEVIYAEKALTIDELKAKVKRLETRLEECLTSGNS